MRCARRCRSCSLFVLALAFLLLLVSFRSLVIPVKAILMNLPRLRPTASSW